LKHGHTRHGSQAYKAIRIPKNTPVPIYIAISAFIFGFAVIWHIYWLALLGLVGIIASIIIRSLDDEPERRLSATQVAKIEAAAKEKYA
jgi:cytochrome o ubiquinol oxidase subunit 1